MRLSSLTSAVGLRAQNLQGHLTSPVELRDSSKLVLSPHIFIHDHHACKNSSFSAHFPNRTRCHVPAARHKTQRATDTGH